MQPEQRASQNCESHRQPIVGRQQGVRRQRVERLADGAGKRGLEEREGHDKGAHVLGRFGEGVFEGGDGGEDFGKGEQDIRAGLGPDVDWDGVALMRS